MIVNDTVRKEILNALVDDLRTNNWIASNSIPINPGKTRYKTAEMPGISVFAGEEESGRTEYGYQNSKIAVELKYVGQLADGEDIFDVVEDVRGYLIDAVMNAADDWSHDREYAGGTIDYPSTEHETFQVSVVIHIHYQTLTNNPYKQER